jgi:hypothetical protein
MPDNILYSSHIISEHRLELESGETPTEFPFAGLHAIMRYPHMRFRNLDLADDIDWLDVAQVTFYQAIVFALCQNNLSVIRTNRMTKMLFKLIRFESEYYTFNRLNPALNSDYFSELVLNAASYAKKKSSHKGQLKALIHGVIDIFLGKNHKYSRPDKQFILHLIQAYDEPEDWFELAVDKSFLGILKKYELNMDESKFQEIVEHHMNVGVWIANNERENKELLLFKKYLFLAVERDLRNRKPKDNH